MQYMMHSKANQTKKPKTLFMVLPSHVSRCSTIHWHTRITWRWNILILCFTKLYLRVQMPLAFITLKDGSDRYVLPLSNFMNVAHTGFN